MTLDASNNLAIGTTTPDVFGRGYGGRILALSGGASQNAIVLNSGSGSAFIEMGVGGTRSAFLNTTASDVNLGTATSIPVIFSTNNTERARITSGGDLLVGTTSSVFTTTKFQVVSSTTQCAGFQQTGGASNATLSSWNNAASGTRTHINFADSAAGTVRGSITTDGTNTAYNTSSDYRLKENAQPLTGSGAFIDALKPKTWTWKETGAQGVGFIAHEVQEVSPGSVIGEKDGEQMQAMEYGSAEFIANIIAELQSLRARVAQLEAK
jgi:hypothetical protein